MAQTLKLIKKIDEVTALNGMVVDSLSSNSSSDAPSIRAVNESVAKKYYLNNSNYDFNNIPYEICYGQWYGSQGVVNAPNNEDGQYFKFGGIIIAISGWNNQHRWIKYYWNSWGNWLPF